MANGPDALSALVVGAARRAAGRAAKPNLAPKSYFRGSAEERCLGRAVATARGSSMVIAKGCPVFSSNELLNTLVGWIPIQLSLSVHEWAHARVAYALGDDTAARAGRLTLNPLVHIDLLGTIIPLLGVPFGWAKPVPVNPERFRTTVPMRTGMMLTAAAGPLSNFALALLCFLTLAALVRLAPDAAAPRLGVRSLLAYAVIVNLSLGAFNLLPLFPLDGSRVVDGLVPERWREIWTRLARVSPILLMVVIFVLPQTGVDLFGWVRWLSGWMIRLAMDI